ncbi:hypothetical protein ACHAAC_17160 [Aeromicrobium sp. CF4.19]|uniref:hypothetical protein n=1 Tax=Aeromicrobium sp. CF4.19 TaxID=3373082 RepID=UPI003EE800F8
MRRIAVVVAATLALMILATGSSSAAEGDDDPGLTALLGECFKKGPIAGAGCATKETSGVAAEALEGTPVGGMADAANKLVKAAESLSSLSPQNMVDTWATSVGEFAIKTVSWISERAVKITAPRFDNDSWLQQYAIAAGLGLILFAGVLILVGARVAKVSQDRVDHAQLLRDAGMSVWLVPVAIVSGPALLVTLGGSISSVGAVFSKEVREGQATERMVGLVEPLVESAGNWAPLGGAFGALLIFLATALLGIYVLLMLYFVSEAQLIFALFLPVVLGVWVYPPWRSMARRIMAGLVALLLMPTVLQFVFWAVWTRVGTSDISGIDAAIRLLVGLALLASVPTLTMMFLPKMIPDGSSAPSVGLSMGGGAVGGAMTSRMLMSQSKRTGTSQNRPIAHASPSQTPPGQGGSAAASNAMRGAKPGAAGKGAGSTAGAGAQTASTAQAATGAGAKAGGAKAGAGAAAAAGPVVASAAAAAMGAKALKQAGQSASTSSMGVADAGGDGGGHRPSDR